MLEGFVGLRANDAIASRNERRHPGNPVSPRALPIRIHGGRERALLDHLAGARGIKARRVGYLNEHVGIAYVATVHEVRAKQRVMKGLATGLGIGPLPEFLGQPAVERVGAPAVGQPLLVHERFHSDVHGIQIDLAAGKQRLDGDALLGGFRMQREMNPSNPEVEALLQLFNTPGTEVAPGSYVVAEDLQIQLLGHGAVPHGFLSIVTCRCPLRPSLLNPSFGPSTDGPVLEEGKH